VEPRTKPRLTFDVEAFLDSAELSRHVVQYRRAQVIFSQGDPCEHVMYIQKGTVRLSVLAKNGKEAVVASLGSGDFLGEGALSGQPVRLATATAGEPTTLLVIPKQQMSRLLHEEHALSDRFIEYNGGLKIHSSLVSVVLHD
jgi:CRP/FNR family transcriptional regulator, cyclic AMP receptor protein